MIFMKEQNSTTYLSFFKNTATLPCCLSYDLCPLSAFNYRSPNPWLRLVNKVRPVEGLKQSQLLSIEPVL